MLAEKNERMRKGRQELPGRCRDRLFLVLRAAALFFPALSDLFGPPISESGLIGQHQVPDSGSPISRFRALNFAL